jgi:hypothetical protein
MMFDRRNQILALVLVVQIILGAVIFWPRSTVEAGGGPLLADFQAAGVTSLVISDTDGNRVALAKSGESWVLPEADDYPANGEAITTVLDKIEAIQTNRLVTQTDASHKRLQVADDDFNRLLDMRLNNDRSYQLYVGSAGGASATHVRAAGQPEVYLTGELTAFDVTAQTSAWVDSLYFTVPATATVKMTLENANGTFEFERDGDTWTMAGLGEDETLNAANVSSLHNQVTSVRMTAPVGTEAEASFGLDDPQAVVTLETGSGETHTLRVGAQQTDDNSYIFGSSDSPYYVRVAEFTGSNLIDKTRADFLEVPPAEEGATGTGSSP